MNKYQYVRNHSSIKFRNQQINIYTVNNKKIKHTDFSNNLHNDLERIDYNCN